MPTGMKSSPSPSDDAPNVAAAQQSITVMEDDGLEMVEIQSGMIAQPTAEY
jgi:hypothetical protein